LKAGGTSRRELRRMAPPVAERVRGHIMKRGGGRTILASEGGLQRKGTGDDPKHYVVVTKSLSRTGRIVFQKKRVGTKKKKKLEEVGT